MKCNGISLVCSDKWSRTLVAEMTICEERRNPDEVTFLLPVEDKLKETRAPITCSYKKARAFVHATIDMCSLWPLYTARSQAIVVPIYTK